MGQRFIHIDLLEALRDVSSEANIAKWHPLERLPSFTYYDRRWIPCKSISTDLPSQKKKPLIFDT